MLGGGTGRGTYLHNVWKIWWIVPQGVSIGGSQAENVFIPGEGRLVFANVFPTVQLKVKKTCKSQYNEYWMMKNPRSNLGTLLLKFGQWCENSSRFIPYSGTKWEWGEDQIERGTARQVRHPLWVGICSLVASIMGNMLIFAVDFLVLEHSIHTVGQLILQGAHLVKSLKQREELIWCTAGGWITQREPGPTFLAAWVRCALRGLHVSKICCVYVSAACRRILDTRSVSSKTVRHTVWTVL